MVKKYPTDTEILRNWMNTVPHGQYKDVTQKILDACLVRKFTLNNWRSGVSRIPMLAKREINRVSLEISGVEIFEIETPT